MEVWHAGARVEGIPPRARAVLAALLVDAGRVVPRDVLVDRVWGDAPPPSHAVTVQSTISRLRRLVEPGVADGAWTVLRTRDPGYVLDVTTDDVDFLNFESLLTRARNLARQGDSYAARAAAADALALWHGVPYADVEGDFVVEERRRLDRLEVSAHELAAELDLSLGRHEELVESLSALVREEPLREGLHASLILALYRSGRQAEALQAYDAVRRLLAEELGVDPGPELQRLHERVLRQDPELSLGAGSEAGTSAVPDARIPDQPGQAAYGGPDGIPAPTTRFVGRDHDLTTVAGALGHGRLVTLVGPGGSGKTRLALEVVRRGLVNPQGVALVELAGIDTSETVADHVAVSLGVGVTTGRPIDAVARSIADRPVLLVLDNCEHVVDGAATAVETLLTRCPGLRVLATSRQPLDLPGEAVLPCGPMDVSGASSDAVRLFLDRAALAAPSMAAATADDLALVEEICAALDGLPLAVELAAACLTTLPLAEVAARVEDRFELLSSGRRTAPPHQRTLAATVQWSVDLLGERETAVFEAASVFHGSFAADALTAVTDDEADPASGTASSGTASSGGRPSGRGPTMTALRALVAKSLVVLDHASGRYRMLETLRWFARDRLDEDRQRRLDDRHAAFLADLVDRIEPTLRSAEGIVGWRRLDAEHENIRAAMAHTLATGDALTALRLAGGVSWWCYRRGHVREGREWLAAALDLHRADPGALPPPERSARLRALLGDALLAYLGGDVPVIAARTDEMRRLAEGHDDASLALALVLRSFVDAMVGAVGPDTVTPDPEAWMALAEGSGVEWVQAEIAMTLGQFARAGGDRDAALAHLDRSAVIALEAGHRWAWVSALWVRAKVLIDVGRGDEAMAAIAESVDGAFADGDRTSTLAGLLTAAGAAAAVHQPRAAARLLGAMNELGCRVGYDPLAMDPLDGQSYVEAVRAALGDEEYEAERARGAELDLGAAVAVIDGLAADVDAIA
ncbi:protein kinase [Intrasporangium oryzae NRRL B-24470]|uniref:Protein kinase n=1 Tax=Intrasporangium oryzae NRRL B-24470 TaxID=1386089 RepID=W9G6X3_9MICO|nr:protein kinase [Intrasporangium oryzae NRRL B-24470]